MFIAAEGYDAFVAGDATTLLSGNSLEASSSLSGSRTSSTRWGYGSAVNLGGGGTHSLRHAIANRTKVFQGSAIRNGQAASYPLFEVWDGATLQCWLEINMTNRQVNVYRGAGTTNLIAQSAANVLGAITSFNYIEWCPTIHSSAGTIEVRLDGVNTVINASALNTQASGNPQISLAAHRITGNTNNVDDYYLFDDQGSANNNFNGDTRIYTLKPISDSSIQFTRNTGASNFSAVDEDDIDDDTTYNASGTVGHKDKFGLEQVPANSVIVAFESRVVFRKDDATARTFRSFVERASNVANGTTRTATSTYSLWTERYENDPTDASALTAAKINAMLQGYEVVS